MENKMYEKSMCVFLGIDRETLAKWTQEGTLPFHLEFGKVYYLKSELKNLYGDENSTKLQNLYIGLRNALKLQS